MPLSLTTFTVVQAKNAVAMVINPHVSVQKMSEIEGMAMN